MRFNPVPDEAVEIGTFYNPTETPYETFFLSSWDEIKHTKSLEVTYEEDGYLSCIRLSYNDRICQFGNPPPEAEISRTHVIRINPGQWIEGFEMIIGDPIESREAGPVGIVNVDVWISGADVEYGSYHPKDRYHRLFVPADGKALVGIIGTSKGNRINSFALIQCEDDQGFPRRAVNDELTRSLSWRNGLPPPHVRVLPNSLEALSSAQQKGLRMEGLLFGTDEQHKDPTTTAARLIRISASGDASRIELTFAGVPGRTPSTMRVAGPDCKGPLKSIDIDGPGGETVVSVLMPPMPEENAGFEWHVPKWFGVVTNHGTQGIFGQQSTIEKACPIQPPSGFAVVGLFLSPAFMQYWTMGVLIAPAASSLTSESPIKVLRDEEGRIWDPEPPPPEWSLCEPCVGSEDREIRIFDPDFTRQNDESKSNESASYLDLMQPVVCFRGLLAAPEWCHLDQIGGFEVQFANISSRFIGMPLEDSQIPLTEEVSYEDFRAGITTVVVAGPRISGSKAHVKTKSELQKQNSGPGKEWYPGGEEGARIIAVHIWGADYLHGIQFEMENGKSSPKWGKAGGEPSVSFRTEATSKGRYSFHDLTRNVEHDEAKRKCIQGVVGLKFIIRKSNGFGSDVLPGPVMVQGLIQRQIA
ncbi:hypothetical protein F4803DRAFT_406646 [Xylaria telfairii]|nr:hypothetical protein F4803DRAFT_406646 [Xylaria telfairii]